MLLLLLLLLLLLVVAHALGEGGGKALVPLQRPAALSLFGRGGASPLLLAALLAPAGG